MTAEYHPAEGSGVAHEPEQVRLVVPKWVLVVLWSMLGVIASGTLLLLKSHLEIRQKQVLMAERLSDLTEEHIKDQHQVQSLITSHNSAIIDIQTGVAEMRGRQAGWMSIIDTLNDRTERIMRKLQIDQ